MTKPLISKVTAAARRAFATLRLSGLTGLEFEEQLAALKKLASGLTAKDVGLSADTIKQRTLFGQKAPTSFIAIDESNDYTIGVFVVRNSSKIPLHDHPDMYGIVKVLLGSVSIKSYTPLSTDGTYTVPKEILRQVAPDQRQDLVPCVYNGSSLVACDTDELACLEPSAHNIHEIEAVSGTAAFLDILGPPYVPDSERDCRYYSVVGTAYDATRGGDITWLVEMCHPDEFWTDKLDYAGPVITREEIIDTSG